MLTMSLVRTELSDTAFDGSLGLVLGPGLGSPKQFRFIHEVVKDSEGVSDLEPPGQLIQKQV